MRKIAWLVWKELVVEVRGLERLPTLALFSTAVLLTLHFSLPPEARARPQVAPGFLWAAILFAGMLELRRAFDGERRDGTLDGLRVAPIDPVVVFAAKVLSSLIALTALACALVPLTAVFFSGRTAGIPAAIGVVALGVVGLLAWGTLFAVIAGETRSAESVLPILLFPLLVPQTIAAVRLLALYLAGTRLQDPATAYVLLLSFDALSIGTSILLFGYVLEE
jgi:heme exporter protein B